MVMSAHMANIVVIALFIFFLGGFFFGLWYARHCAVCGQKFSATCLPCEYEQLPHDARSVQL